MFDFIDAVIKPHKRQKRRKSRHGENGRNGLYALNDPKAPVVEAFRTLRTNIGFASVGKPYQAILVTSPVPREGKSTVVANLAVVMAQAGNNVLIMDADLRKPTQHRIFNVSNNIGLVNIMVQNEKLEKVAHNGLVEKLHLVTSGPIPPNPSELFMSDKMGSLLADLRRDYDVILIDSPPVMAVTDPVLLAAQVDGVILVVKADDTRIDLINNAIEQLKKANEKFMGVVLNQFRAASSGYGYYYYYGGESKQESK